MAMKRPTPARSCTLPSLVPCAALVLTGRSPPSTVAQRACELYQPPAAAADDGGAEGGTPSLSAVSLPPAAAVITGEVVTLELARIFLMDSAARSDQETQIMVQRPITSQHLRQLGVPWSDMVGGADRTVTAFVVPPAGGTIFVVRSAASAPAEAAVNVPKLPAAADEALERDR